jgi:hypothetical protein
MITKEIYGGFVFWTDRSTSILLPLTLQNYPPVGAHEGAKRNKENTIIITTIIFYHTPILNTWVLLVLPPGQKKADIEYARTIDATWDGTGAPFSGPLSPTTLLTYIYCSLFGFFFGFFWLPTSFKIDLY